MYKEGGEILTLALVNEVSVVHPDVVILKRVSKAVPLVDDKSIRPLYGFIWTYISAEWTELAETVANSRTYLVGVNPFLPLNNGVDDADIAIGIKDAEGDKGRDDIDGKGDFAGLMDEEGDKGTGVHDAD